MRKTLMAALLAGPLSFGLFASAAQAAEVGYNYLELGYSQVDLDGTSVDFDGGALNGSALLGEQFFIYGGYGAHDSDPGSVDLDVTRLGFGWRHGIGESSDLVINANWVNYDIGSSFLGGDIDGYEVELGLRTAHGDRFESLVAIGYEDGNDVDGDVYGRLSGHFKFTQRWGLVGSASFHDGGNEYFVGPRLSF